MKLPTLYKKTTTTDAQDAVPDIPGSCVILVPTLEGNVPVYVSDEDICSRYDSTGHFCSLPASFRDSWQHNCPFSAEAELEAAPFQSATVSAAPQLDIPTASPSPLSSPVSTAPVTASVLDAPQETATASPQHPINAWNITVGPIFGAITFIMVIFAATLGCPRCSCRSWTKEERRPRRPQNSAWLDNTEGIVYPGFGRDYERP